MPIFEGPDFRHHTPRRAMGSETEFTIQLQGYPDISQIEAVEPHIAYLANPREVWLRNGGRLYYDLLSNPLFEYATPECLSGQEVLLHEKAGELLTATAAYEMTGGKEFTAYKRTGYSQILDADGKKSWKQRVSAITKTTQRRS